MRTWSKRTWSTVSTVITGLSLMRVKKVIPIKSVDIFLDEMTVDETDYEVSKGQELDKEFVSKTMQSGPRIIFQKCISETKRRFLAKSSWIFGEGLVFNSRMCSRML